MGGIMKAISYLLRKNTTNAASQSGARVPICIEKSVGSETLSAINGSASLAELKQVLGVAQYHIHFNSGDLDELTEPGTWLLSFGPNVINAPANSGQAILEVVRLGTTSSHLLQRVTMESNGKVYTRCKKATAEGFYPWSE